MKEVLFVYFLGYAAMYILMVLAIAVSNPSQLKNWTHWVILAMIAATSWMGFAFMVITIVMEMYGYYVNKKRNKDNETGNTES